LQSDKYIPVIGGGNDEFFFGEKLVRLLDFIILKIELRIRLIDFIDKKFQRTSVLLVAKTEKEGFEPSRRANDLHP